MREAYSAEAIFTGNEWISGYTILCNNGTIEQVISYTEPGSSIASRHFADCYLVPAFIDAQVYGAGGRLFSAYPEAATLELMNSEFLKTGTVLFLPTIATNSKEVFYRCIDAVREYWQQGGKGVYGLHLEGPWINEARRGAHIKEFIHAPQPHEVREILTYGKGVVKMITLAPEVCDTDTIKMIRDHQVIISAGHSNARYQEAINSFDAGIRTVTHLYNAMSGLNHREPGLVGASFLHDEVMASIIPDGIHVDFEAIAIAKKLMGHRLFAITDAVTETNIGPYQHQLSGDKYESNGILSGSALSMHKAFTNLVNHAAIPMEEALRMCSLYPAMVIGSADGYGRIAPGYKAQFLVINKKMEIVDLVVKQT